VAAHGLAHPALRVPVASFEERLGTSLRYCVITPAIEPLPARPERALVLESAAGLIAGLDFLHSLSLSFSGKLTPALFAVADEHLVWADLGSGPLHTDAAPKARAADTRALADQLFAWLTGRTKYAADVTLASPLKTLFSQALTGRGFPSAQALGVAWAEAYQPEQPRPQVEVRSGRRTDVGRLRTLNEDSVLALELVRIVQSQPEPLGLYAVADGMGGHAAGEVASSTIVNTMAQRAVGDLANGLLAAVDPVDYLAWLQGLVEAANRALFDMRQQAGTDMGSTLVAMVVDGAQAYVAHVGDSRAYLINASGIHRLTEDHSLVERLVATGQITAEQARTHEQRNVIYRTMGDKARVEVETAAHPVAPGDLLLLCSDGLSGMVDDPTLLSLIRAAPSLPAACEAMVAAANAAGGTDNISAVLIEVASTK
jgi:protein phosphatase